MNHKAYICQIKNLRNHPHADRLYLGECFGNTVAVSKEGYYADMIGVYFPTDLQLSTEFCQYNNLLRLKDENGHTIPGGGYMDPDKRNVKAIRLRKEKSDGLFLPLRCLDYCFEDGAAAHLQLGDTVDVLNGYEICKKYIPKGKVRRENVPGGNKVRKHRVPIAPLFAEHADTEQLAYNLGAFKPGDEIEITLKLHGTSQRTGYLPVFKGYRRSIWDKLRRLPGKPIYDWDYVTGTRRTVLEDGKDGYYGSNDFRLEHAEKFRGKLWKGETVYYEVVGFLKDGTPIMPQCSNKKLNDKDFEKRYGEITTFSYGCAPKAILAAVKAPEMIELLPTVPQSDIYVYRMTMTNEDGEVVEYTPDFMRYRCEQMGIKTVPLFAKGRVNFSGTVDWQNIAEEVDEQTLCLGREMIEGDPFSWAYVPGDNVKELAERFYDGPDPVGKSHVREGVVVRIVNRPKFTAYKDKNFAFKVLEGIIKEEAEAPDIEEADGVEEEYCNE